MSLWVVRHAPVVLSGICYGQSEVETSIPGDEAARLVASRLPPGLAVATVWTSRFARCRGVAETMAASLEAELRVDARLSELNFGAWELKSYAEIDREDSARFRAWCEGWEHATAPGGEGLPALLARVGEWWREVTSGPAGAALAVTHAGVIRALDVVRGEATAGAAWKAAVPHLEPRCVA